MSALLKAIVDHIEILREQMCMQSSRNKTYSSSSSSSSSESLINGDKKKSAKKFNNKPLVASPIEEDSEMWDEGG